VAADAALAGVEGIPVMPDLANRREREEELAAALLLLLDDAAKRISATGGQASWDQIESELRRALVPVLQRVYIEAAAGLAAERGRPIERDAIVGAAIEWANNRAAELAKELVARDREKIALLLEGIRSGIITVEEAAAQLAAAYGPARAAELAITEVTRAVSAGEIGLIALLGLMDETGAAGKPEAYWHTEQDARVCPECAPLDGTPESVWGKRHQYGPPAHPNCRCWLDWQ
jgi:hypothetical protein